ncbi:MAG: FAD:protein FMN transferase, partial [Verrucomicrobiota bacterium]
MVLASQSIPVKIEAKVAYDEANALYDLQFFAMGTSCKVLFAAPDQQTARAFAQEAVHWVAHFEGKYSRFRDDSLISEINRNAGKGWTAVDGEVESIFGICDELNHMTHGVLDPTMHPLISLWDFKKERSALPSDSEVEEAMRLVGWSKVQRKARAVRLPDEGMALDFGGFGKEYAV